MEPYEIRDPMRSGLNRNSSSNPVSDQGKIENIGFTKKKNDKQQ